MKKYTFYLLIILLIAIFFRFYKINDWLFFGMDQEYEALIIKNITNGRHFPLIGVNAGDTGLYLGPFFIYFAAIPYFLFSGNPIGGAVTASLLGILTCYFVYQIGRRMFNKRIGLFAAFFYSGSFLISFYDRKFWNPTPVPLFSLLIGYILYQLANNKIKYLPWLALIFGLAIQCHLSMFIFLPIIVYILWKKYPLINRKLFTFSIVIFLFLQLPILIFDFRHNFINSRALVNLALNKNQENSSYSNLYERSSLFISAMGRVFWMPFNPDLFLESGQCRELAGYKKNAHLEGVILLSIFTGIFILWMLEKRKSHKTAVKIILMLIFVTLLFVMFYNRQIFEYYFLYLFPWVCIILGCSANFVWKREHGVLAVTPFLLLFIGLNLITLFTVKFNYSYKEKLAAINFVKEVLGNRSYKLEVLGECTRYGGYRYLFEYFVGKPVSSYMDSYFSWLYKDDFGKEKPSAIVLLSIIDPRGEQNNIAKWEAVKLEYLRNHKIEIEKSLGNIKVFILSL